MDAAIATKAKTMVLHNDWRRVGAQSAVLMLLWGGAAVPSLAQDAFPPNPLEITEPDPLLPRLLVDRPLSPQELSTLTAAVDELDRQAQLEFDSGNAVGAFEIWLRVLRLRRVLGTEQEVESLSHVGAIAWRENQTTEVRLITQRLQQIEADVRAQTPLNYDLLLTIAQAYQSMRAIDPALTAYQDILTLARQEQNRDRELQTLEAMGQLHLAWFDYANAATVYQQLVALVPNDRERQIQYLQQLAYSYQQGNQPEPAIAAQQQLATVYEQQEQYAEIPPLKLAIGDSYLAIDRPDLAATSYQEAFGVSRTTQQYAYAADALQRLANLYRSIDRPNDALTVYQLLLDVHQQSYNTYGLMETYDQIGQLYRSQGNNGQAIAAFQRGLSLAQQLNYRTGYFTTQIQQINAPQ